MKPLVFEVAGLAAYGGAVAFLYRAVGFLAERDYVAAILAAAIGLAVARLAGDLLRFALWRTWAEARTERPEEPGREEP